MKPNANFDEYHQRLTDHQKVDETNFNFIKEDFRDVKDDIKLIKENHLAHIQASMTQMEKSIAATDANLEWLMKFFWIVSAASIGGLVTGILNLLNHAR